MLQPISKNLSYCLHRDYLLHSRHSSAFCPGRCLSRNTESFPVFLSGQSPIVALFCPVNESVWEHLKLLYFPFLFVSIWEYLSLHPVVLPFFYCRYLGVLLGMFLLFLFLHIFRDSRPEFPDLRHPAFLFQCNIFIWNV